MKTVHIEQTIKKLGNSSGVIIPAATMRELGLDISDVVELDITPKRKKARFEIHDLIANTDFDAQGQDEALNEWDSMPIAGREIV